MFWKRFSGSFSIAWRMIASSSGSMSGTRVEGFGGRSVTCIMSTSRGRSLMKGRRPVASS